MIEKHFTLDKDLPGPDHRFSADPCEFRTLTDAIRTLEKNLGSSQLEPATSEEVGRREYRLSCVAARDLQAGVRLKASDIAFRRPGHGFPPKESARLLNRPLAKTITAGHVFVLDDFLSEHRPCVTLRRAVAKDANMVFRWRNDPFLVARASSQKPVTWEEHVRWFQETITGIRRSMFIVLVDGVPAGQVRFDRPQNGAPVISAYLLEPYTGRGLGVDAIRKACQLMFKDSSITNIVAFIREDNASSCSGFRKAGFHEAPAPLHSPPHHLCLVLRRTAQQREMASA